MKSDRWNTDLDAITKSFKIEFAVLTPDQLNWKPNARQWSIAQCIHHLIVVNESYFPILDQVRNQAYYSPRYGKIGFITRFFGKIVLDAVEPSRRKKMKTFTIWEPAISLVRSDILDQFEKHQHELKHLITSSEDLIEKGTVISSPANRMVVYKLETAFDIMIAHEKRHLEQAKEVNQLRMKSVK
jgi:DinB superfamily